MFEFSESEEIEFKSSFNNDTITREIVAFSMLMAEESLLG